MKKRKLKESLELFGACSSTTWKSSRTSRPARGSPCSRRCEVMPTLLDRITSAFLKTTKTRYQARYIVGGKVERAPPYTPGEAVSRLYAIGKEIGGWSKYQAGALPSPGDMVLVGDNASGGVEHVYTVIEAPAPDAIRSVDGGQIDKAGFQMISEKLRSWTSGKDKSVNSSDPGAASSGGRVIKGWVDAAKLASLVGVA